MNFENIRREEIYLTIFNSYPFTSDICKIITENALDIEFACKLYKDFEIYNIMINTSLYNNRIILNLTTIQWRLNHITNYTFYSIDHMMQICNFRLYYYNIKKLKKKLNKYNKHLKILNLHLVRLCINYILCEFYKYDDLIDKTKFILYNYTYGKLLELMDGYYDSE